MISIITCRDLDNKKTEGCQFQYFASAKNVEGMYYLPRPSNSCGFLLKCTKINTTQHDIFYIWFSSIINVIESAIIFRMIAWQFCYYKISIHNIIMLSNETASRYDEQKASWKLILSLHVHHNKYLTRYLKEKK